MSYFCFNFAWILAEYSIIMDTARQINKVELRNLRMEDYDQLAKSFRRIYANHDVFWTHEQIQKLITIFP